MPEWVEPQLTQLVKAPPTGTAWAHEIKYDGYRMHARINHGGVQLLTRTGLDWTANYPAVAAALRKLPVRQAYLDGELCGVRPDGTTSFSLMQNAHAKRGAASLVYFMFDLLHLDGEDLTEQPLVERKARLEALLDGLAAPLQHSGHVIGGGEPFYRQACKLRLEGIVSKRLDAPYRPGNRGLWVKTKCVNREEFVVVGWTEPEGGRPYIGALLLAYHAPDGRLVYAGRAGSGMSDAELKRVWQRLQPLAIERMPLDVSPPRTSRFGSPLVLSRVHWVRSEMVVEITYLTWTDDGLLRQVVYQGIREGKPASDVRRELPHAVPPPSPSPIRARAPARPAGGVPAENILQLLPSAAVPTREALAAYWSKVADRALRHLGHRPLKLVRHVDGVTFYHKGALPPVPSSVHQLRIEKAEGGEGVRLWVDDLAGLLGLVEIGVVELHPWGATVDDIERPDMLVFDLDPGEGVEWEFVIEAALGLRRFLAERGHESWPKVTGGKGLHVMVPMERRMRWRPAHDLCKRLAQEFAAREPARYTTSASLAKRPGKLFIDYLRNGRGTTAVGAWSPRARPRFPVAVPVRWADVQRGIHADAFTMQHLPDEQRKARRRLQSDLRS